MTDKMGKILERMEANIEVLEGAAVRCKELHEEMYKQNLKIVQENKRLVKLNDDLRKELQGNYGN